jgi:hypothetical protein
MAMPHYTVGYYTIVEKLMPCQSTADREIELGQGDHSPNINGSFGYNDSRDVAWPWSILQSWLVAALPTFCLKAHHSSHG